MGTDECTYGLSHVPALLMLRIPGMRAECGAGFLFF